MLLTANSRDELLYELSQLDTRVSPRSLGRTTEQTERHGIAYLLASLPPSDLAFPLTVEHGDRPDFVLRFIGCAVGVEFTEAIAENVARASAIREKGVGPRVHFIPRAEPDEPARTSATLRREIQEDKPGGPWVGDESEQSWASAMLHFTQAKVAKAAKPGFTNYEHNWLLIYDNWSVPALKHAEAVRRFQVACFAHNIFCTFERVFVLDSQFLCEVGASVQIHLAKDLHVGS